MSAAETSGDSSARVDRAAHIAALSVFVLASVLRMTWVAYAWQQRGASFEFDDERLHWQLAHNLVTVGSLVSDDPPRYAARMPVYPLFLAAWAVLGESGVQLARISQAFLGALVAALVTWFARAAVGSLRVGLIAGVLAALDPYAIYFSSLLLTEVVFTLLSIMATAAVWRYAKSRPTVTFALVAGLLCGLLVLTRPSAAGWAALLLLMLALSDRGGGRAGRAAALAVGAVILLIPWGVRNYAVLGAPALLSTNGGVTLYDAQGPQARGDSDQAFLAGLKLEGLGEVQADRRLRELAVAQMRRDPARVLRLAAVKFVRTWNPVPNYAEASSGAKAWASAAFSIPVFGLAVVGVVRLWHRRWLLALLALPIVYFTLVHMVYVGSLRYRVPLMPFVEILAAAALAPMRRTSGGARENSPRNDSHPVES